MQKLTGTAILLIAAYALSTGATAQNVYKCGSSYSQSPCPGGATIDVTDTRTPAQKEQTDSAANRDAKTADAMEKARIQQEKSDLTANTPSSAATNAPFWANASSLPASSPDFSNTKKKAPKSVKQKTTPSTVDKVKKTAKKKKSVKTDKPLASALSKKKVVRHPETKTQP